MELLRVHGSRAGEARGVTLVIDVIRAFSVAAYALAGGASAIWLVRTVEEAFALREHEPSALLAGEVGGRLIPGFDHNNSPAAMSRAEVAGRTLIQRTGAGTQGAVNATGASAVLCCALVNARATADYARTLAEREGQPITLMPTARPTEEMGIAADEDEVCADYLEALLRGEHGDARATQHAAEALAAGIEHLRAVGRLGIFERGWPDLPPDDVPAFLAVDRFAFVMLGERRYAGEIEYVALRRVEGNPR